MPLFVHGGLFARVIFNSVSILSHETAENLDVLKNVISLALACLEIVVISLFFHTLGRGHPKAVALSACHYLD